MAAARPLSPIPQRSDDAPSVGSGIENAGRISTIAIAAGGVALVLYAVAEWFWIGAEDSRVLTRLLASLFLATAPAVFATLLVEWMLQRKLVHQMLRQLKEPFGSPAWAAESRAACPFDAGNNPAGNLHKARLYSQKIEEWKEPFQTRLKAWYFLSAAAVAAPSIGYFLSMTPERARHLSPLGSLLPAALGLLLGAASALVTFFDDVCWTRLFLEWKKWASTKDRAPVQPPPEEHPVDDSEKSPDEEPPAAVPVRPKVTDDWDAPTPMPRTAQAPVQSMNVPAAATLAPQPSRNGSDTPHLERVETVEPRGGESSTATNPAPREVQIAADTAEPIEPNDAAARHSPDPEPSPAPVEPAVAARDGREFNPATTSHGSYDNY